MIINAGLVQTFEYDLSRRTPVDYQANLRIVEALYTEARLLNVWPPADPLVGIETDIRFARALNVHRAA